MLLVSAAGFAQTSNSSNEKNILWSRDKPYCDSVLVDGAEYRVIKARESLEVMLAAEKACLQA